MHILVTGGCGFVGTALTEGLLNLGHDVTVVDIMWFGNYLGEHKNLTVLKEDIRNTENIPMDGIDTIIHLANIANDPCGELDAKLSWEVNVLATMGLVERAIKCKVKQFIYASSGSVYGVKEEDKVTEELPLVPISDYNKTKMISERVLLSYQDSIAVQCLRPATICGYSKRCRLDLSVNMLTMQALSRGKITVFGGDQTRPNIHLKDMLRVYIHFLESGQKATGIYNAGFENISIMEIAQRIKEKIPTEITVTESNDPRSYRLDSSKLLATGFEPRYCVADGIGDIIKAYEAGILKDDDGCYNIRVMKKLGDLTKY
ncbi:MAG: NAD-dependent epimerase/dehydratase family protein [Sedimentisphaerales bacterium]|nr:NAD-dependent epimerase/dehydratase family protein [Sedimentisphaerales bacterium]